MTRRRALAASLFTVVIIAVLAVIAYSSYQASVNRQQVYVLRHDVLTGQVIGPNDFVASMVRADPGQFRTAESRAMATLVGRSRYVADLRRDDILRLDDTESADRTVQVPVNIAIGGTGVGLGDSIDIYAESNGSTLLVGRHLPVLALGNPLLVGVDARSSAYWVALSFSTTRLVAVRSFARSSSGEPVEVTGAQALCVLAAIGSCSSSAAPTR